MEDCTCPLMHDWGGALMHDRGTAIMGEWGPRSYIACHRNSNSLERLERATRRIRPLSSSLAMQRRACGTESATSSAIRSVDGQAFPFPPANCMSLAKISFSDGVRSGLFKISDGTSAPSNKLNGLKASPIRRPRVDRRSWREATGVAILCWRWLMLSDTLGAVTVFTRTSSPKPFLLKAPLQRCLRRLEGSTGRGLTNF